MPRFAANLSMMFNEVPFLERFARASAAGFEAVEPSLEDAYMVLVSGGPPEADAGVTPALPGVEVPPEVEP